MTGSRRLGLVVLVAAVALIAVVSITAGHGSGARQPENRGASYLLRIAQEFNDDYSANSDGLVYDRWDLASRLVIGRARYIEFHRACDTAPGPAVVEGVSRVVGGYWSVRYSIGGDQLVDYWHYEDGRWLFSLIRSNPAAVTLYELPLPAYLAEVGCSDSKG
jgi:hypothetical protein